MAEDPHRGARIAAACRARYRRVDVEPVRRHLHPDPDRGRRAVELPRAVCGGIRIAAHPRRVRRTADDAGAVRSDAGRNRPPSPGVRTARIPAMKRSLVLITTLALAACASLDPYASAP